MATVKEFALLVQLKEIHLNIAKGSVRVVNISLLEVLVDIVIVFL